MFGVMRCLPATEPSWSQFRPAVAVAYGPISFPGTLRGTGFSDDVLYGGTLKGPVFALAHRSSANLVHQIQAEPQTARALRFVWSNDFRRGEGTTPWARERAYYINDRRKVDPDQVLGYVRMAVAKEKAPRVGHSWGRCFHSGALFEAHQHRESVWLAAQEPERTFLQGLIQVAGAFHHFQRGNYAGAISLLRSALGRLG
jgi:hypothetical protein